MRDLATGRPRGFGFVTFADNDSINKVLQEPTHFVDEKRIDPKPAVPRDQQSNQTNINQSSSSNYQSQNSNRQQNNFNNTQNQSFDQKPDTLFAGGLPPSATEDDLRNSFSQFGNIVEIKMMFDRETGRSRGFAFIQFENESNVKQAIQTCEQGEGLLIHDKRVDVKRAVHKKKAIMQQQHQQMQMQMQYQMQDMSGMLAASQYGMMGGYPGAYGQVANPMAYGMVSGASPSSAANPNSASMMAGYAYPGTSAVAGAAGASTGAGMNGMNPSAAMMAGYGYGMMNPSMMANYGYAMMNPAYMSQTDYQQQAGQGLTQQQASMGMQMYGYPGGAAGNAGGGSGYDPSSISSAAGMMMGQGNYDDGNNSYAENGPNSNSRDTDYTSDQKSPKQYKQQGSGSNGKMHSDNYSNQQSQHNSSNYRNSSANSNSSRRDRRDRSKDVSGSGGGNRRDRSADRDRASRGYSSGAGGGSNSRPNQARSRKNNPSGYANYGR
ncbi:putative RNA-binding protein [Smittium culicis]|uniref:Putative RNA-binding protein n=1 Tax=Smittium culicis TaxID=133412 RepID=A0A1R1YPW7_9FUNG|nr:putative RNA-binding protein [Smittium culicis]